MNLISGQKIALDKLIQNGQVFTVKIVAKADFPVDISCFGIGMDDRLFHDDYMIFYNQPKSPQHEVEYRAESESHFFHFDLSKANPAEIHRFVICATADAVNSTMHDLMDACVEILSQQGQVLAQYKLDSSQFNLEKAIMLTEIYCKGGLWRMAAIGQGFNGGLKALVEHFGGEVAAEEGAELYPSAAQQSAPAASVIDLKKRVVLDKIEKTAPHLIDLAKKSLISLEKNSLIGAKARVALILDYSGSMSNQYKNGDVQKVLDRIMPLAVNFDDDGSFECWAFAEKALRLSDVSLSNLKNYIETEQGGHKKWNAGARYNNEPAVLESAVEYFTKISPSQLPVYIVFISDGGVSETRKIKQILKHASNYPIFWQFVGIGGRNYGVLEQLDTMAGRAVDNCSFFEMDNIHSMPESQLYDLLLQEFPLWLKEAKLQNIIPK
ncbi:tellurium resistance protein [Acinetobacter sp. WCHAc010034]|uniref:vWA domain-containing protein n=1 Tax=Acinetobacter sp. WCHAc010034 TaxID=1879049 RepID=UPI00083AD62A|nr:VWA domain-containing protein [Acinetobacter sp. WCHAc010034]AYA02548.1 tellurium resistance protein [Acinetobacter sp. WCHAc010034]